MRIEGLMGQELGGYAELTGLSGEQPPQDAQGWVCGAQEEIGRNGGGDRQEWRWDGKDK